MIEFKMDLVIGAATIGLALLAQAAPGVEGLPLELIGKLGPIGMFVWLTIHHTMVTIPRMEERFSKLLEAQEERHMQVLKEKRDDYLHEITQIRADFRAELTQQRSDFAKMLSSAGCKAKES